LRQAVHGDMEKLLDEVTGAVNTAPDGAVISGSEEAVRDAILVTSYHLTRRTGGSLRPADSAMLTAIFQISKIGPRFARAKGKRAKG